MHDLGEAEDRVVEAVVVAMHEHQHAAAGLLGEALVEQGDDLLAAHEIGLHRGEGCFRVGGQLGRPFHRTGLVVRRDGDGDLGEGGLAPVAAEHFSGHVGRLAGGGDQHLDARGIGGERDGILDRDEHIVEL